MRVLSDANNQWRKKGKWAEREGVKGATTTFVTFWVCKMFFAQKHQSFQPVYTTHTGQPCYLADLTEPYRPSRVLQSTNSHLLAVPSCPKCSASRAFCVSSPNNWNSLHLNICSSDSLATFQSRLKSHLFASSRLVTHTPAPQIRPSTIGAI